MNGNELNSEWQRVREKVASYGAIDEKQMNAFFSRLQPQAMSEGFLMVTADNDFIKTWIEKHYLKYIEQALKELHGVDFTVIVEIDINQDKSSGEDGEGQSNARQNPPAPTESEPQMTKAPATAETVEKPVSVEAGHVEAKEAKHESEAMQAPSRQQGPDDRPKRDGDSFYADQLSPTSTLTFENFVIGESNRMAYSMALSVAEEPGRSMLNPLFIYGKSGLGKTHLMRAIQNYVNETRPDLKTVYVDSADFLSEYVDATVAHDKDKTSFHTFKNRYQEADVLLIDDIQFFQGKDQTLDIVFQIFNSLVDEGRQVVLSADRAPKNITMDERYQSRFNSGGTFDIQPPEVETKLGIIKSFIEEYQLTSGQPNFHLSEDVERYIAEISSSNIRELKSAVTKIIYAMNAFGKQEITSEEISRLLENHFSGGVTKKLTIPDIQKEVERYFDVTHADIVGQKRSRKIVYARQVAIYLVRDMLDMSYQYIGKHFGGRDHTTIMYSVTSIETKLKESREVREEIENIKNRIKEM